MRYPFQLIQPILNKMNCCYFFVRGIFILKRKIEQYFYVPEKEKIEISGSDLPWLWIGAEMKSGVIITLTEDINKVVSYGDTVTPFFLESYTELKNVKRWLYLDSLTLLEQEIPPSGLVIKDDTEQ